MSNKLDQIEIDTEEVNVFEQEIESLSAMRLSKFSDWTEEDKEFVDSLKESVTKQVQRNLSQLFAIENELLSKVRILQPDGQYAKDVFGAYIEDWSRIEVKDMLEFINAGSATLLVSTKYSFDSLTDAVIAKYVYDDTYDAAYSSFMSGTIDDKTAKAKRSTLEERWLAIYKSLVQKYTQTVIDKFESQIKRVQKVVDIRMDEIRREWYATREFK